MNRNFQIHHIIPVNVYNLYHKQLNEILGKDAVQSYNNRIALFVDPEAAAEAKVLHQQNKLKDIPLGSSHHIGSHPSYDKVVNDRLNEIIKSNSSNETKKVLILDLQFHLRNMLIEGFPPLKRGNYTADEHEALMNDYLDKKTLSKDTIYDPDNPYQKQLLELYELNDKKYSSVLNDPYHMNGKAWAKNKLFTEVFVNSLMDDLGINSKISSLSMNRKDILSLLDSFF